MDEQKQKASDANFIARKNSGGLTWVEAARVVLERYDSPVPHNEILKIIQDENLRACLPGKVQLACLNAMLNANCRGSNAIFYRAPGQHACFGMKKNLQSSCLDSEELVETNKPIGAVSSNSSSKISTPIRGVSSPLRSALTAARAPGAALRVMPPKKRAKLDESDVAKLPTSAKVTNTKQFDREGRDGVKELVKKTVSTPKLKAPDTVDARDESVEIDPASFRLQEDSNHKPAEDKYVWSQKNSRSRNESLLVKIRKADSLKQENNAKHRDRPSPAPKKRVPVPRTSSAVAKARIQESEAPSSPVSASSSSKDPSAPGFLEVKFRRLKKMSHVEQLKRTMEGKVDLMTPESILTSVEIKSLINLETFTSLPAAYQYQLLMLLPAADRKKGPDNVLRITKTAVNNEFFAKACQEWRDKLSDGDFNTDIIQKIKQDGEKESKLDVWKREYFEPSWGNTSVANPVADCSNSSSYRVSPWDAFLNFAENAGKDHEQELLQMQATLRQQAEAERLRKLAAIAKSSASVKASKGKHEGGGGAKNRSKRALKKAQMLQLQLKEAKAKVVAEARSSGKKNTKRQREKEIEAQGGCNRTVDSDDGPANSQLQSRLYTNDLVFSGGSHADDADDARVSKNDVRRENSTNSSLMHNRYKDGVTHPLSMLKGKSELRQQSNQARRKSMVFSHSRNINDTKGITSRIIRAASIYSRGNTQCPCSLAPMAPCKECGAFCHKDCIDASSRCNMCTATC